MFTFLIVAALAALASAGTLTRDVATGFPRSPVGRIVGGREAMIEDFPYQLSMRVWGGHMCGASIISDYWALTAAHCSEFPLRSYSIYAGSTSRNKNGSLHTVAEIIAHENFGANWRGVPSNDIALMRVNEPFVMDATRQPIALFDDDEKVVAGSLAVITGWGHTESNGYNPAPEILQTTEVPIIAKPECSMSYQDFGGIAENQICAGYPQGGKDTCQGDSGGPMAVAGRLAGIVSWGNGCALPGRPGVYTEVAAYRSWIKKHADV